MAQFGGAKPELIANPDTTQIPVWGFQEEVSLVSLALARKGQNSVDGTGTCRLFTIGSIFVSFLSSLVSFIFPDFTVRFVVQCYEEPVKISDGEKVDVRVFLSRKRS